MIALHGFLQSIHDDTYKDNYLANQLVINWRPPSQSELTPIKLNIGLTHLG